MDCCPPSHRSLWMLAGAGLLVGGVALGRIVGWLLP